MEGLVKNRRLRSHLEHHYGHLVQKVRLAVDGGDDVSEKGRDFVTGLQAALDEEINPTSLTKDLGAIGVFMGYVQQANLRLLTNRYQVAMKYSELMGQPIKDNFIFEEDSCSSCKSS
ncbi:hypothetical protein GOV13_05665 [Candidatus Pacearchaeota archaeon]|nr:hypothetical protein [Candidatus Pacearchaeota archaeon]